MRRHPCGLWHRLYEWLRGISGTYLPGNFLAPGGCCSLSIRSRWILPRQFDPSDWLSSHHRNNLCPLTWLPSVLLHGGREAQLLFLIVASGYFSSPSRMRMKALYLASFMSDVVKPYIEQTNDVTPGMSTSMDVSDRTAVTCQSDISATSRWNGFNFHFLKKHNVKSQPPRSMHAYTKQCFRHPSLFLVQNGSNIRHNYVSSMISGTVVEDDNTSARSSGKPKKNHQDIRVGRPYQYVSLRCLFRMKGDERVSFFVSTLKVLWLSDHPVMFVVVLHHRAFFQHVRCRSFCCQLLVHNGPSSIRS